MAETQKTILCAGIGVQDIMMRVEHFPEPGTKISASDFITAGGGCAANAATAIARLGGQAIYAGPLGDDAASDWIVSNLERDKVDCSGVTYVEGGLASVSLILIDAEGEKEISTRRGSRLETALPADAAGLVARAGAVLVDNRFREYVVPICQAAHAQRKTLVIDGDQATTPDDSLFPLGTHVIFSCEGLRGTTGMFDLGSALTEMAKRLKGFLAATDGPNGIFWLENGALRHMPAFRIKAVDTLGAGDTFHGAFTLALTEGQDEVSALRFANAAAAVKCLKFGGSAVTPTRAEIADFLRSQR